MESTIKFLGLLIVIIGFSLIIKPDIVIGWVEQNQDKRSIYLLAIIARLVIGCLLINVASRSIYPTAVKIIGYITVLAAIVFILMGSQNFKEMLSSFIPYIIPYSRLVGIIAIILGIWLFYAFAKAKESVAKPE